MYYTKKIKEQKRTHYFLYFYIAAFFSKFLNTPSNAAQYKREKKNFLLWLYSLLLLIEISIQ